MPMISLSLETEKKIEELVATGHYDNGDEVVKRALEALTAESELPTEIPTNSKSGFGCMKGTIKYMGDIITPIDDWFENGRGFHK
ncbi:MAG: hypothetical protein ABI579_01650 [Candidatus Sumerlaeota bacterium]